MTATSKQYLNHKAWSYCDRLQLLLKGASNRGNICTSIRQSLWNLSVHDWAKLLRMQHSCMDLRTGSDLQRSGIRVGPAKVRDQGRTRFRIEDGPYLYGDLQTRSDLQRSGTGVGPGSELKITWQEVRATMGCNHYVACHMYAHSSLLIGYIR